MKTVIRNSYTPKIGDYCETIVVDKETENAYIFDCDGIFTEVPQPVDVEKILEEAAAYTDEQVAPLTEKLDTIEEGAQVNVIEHVLRNGTELTITNKTVNVTVPAKTSDLTNDGSDGTDTYVESDTLDNYYTKSETDTQIGYETDAREIADSGLQEQIDAIVASSDVVDIVGTYAALQNYDTSTLSANDIIKVLTDESKDDATTYYRWTGTTWLYIGAEGPFYTKAESDALFTPMTRTINNKALSSDITLTAQDVGALPDSTVIPTVNDATLTIQKNGTTIDTFTANSSINKTVDITVPTKVSDITNDLDFVTKGDIYDEQCESGSTITFQDSAPSKLSSFSISGNTVQNGTPTLDAPVAVQTVTGENVVKISDGQGNEQSYEVNLGKNLFDKDNANIFNGYLGASGIVEAANARAVYIPVVAGQTYTFSRANSTSQVNDPYYAFIANEPAGGGQYIEGRHAVGRNDLTFTGTAPAGSKYLIFYFAWNPSAEAQATILSTYQLEKGSTATSYAPYFEPIELCKIGTYQDYIWNDNGTWKVHKAIGKHVFDGSESFTLDGNYNDIYQYRWADSSVISTSDQDLVGVISDRFIGYKYRPSWTIDFSVALRYNANAIRFMTSASTTVANFQTWLSTNQTIVYYMLATPTDTEITNEALVAQLEAILSQGYTYAGTNNITTVISAGNVQGELEICYVDTIIPYATKNKPGIVQVGDGLVVDSNGVISATGLTSINWDDIEDAPTDVSYFTNDAGYITSASLPTVNDGMLTIQKNGVAVATFSANQSGNSTANISVPAKTSDLTNDSGFITTAALSNYYTKGETYSQQEVNSIINTLTIPTKTSDLTNDGADGTSTYVETNALGDTAFSNDYNDLDNLPTIPSYSDFTGATSSTAGAHGLVPAPAAGDEGKFLQGNGVWATVSTGQTYTAGNGIDIDANNEISVDTAVVATQTDLSGKQDTLTAGDAIDITNNVISVEADSALDVSSTKPVQNSVITAALNRKNKTIWTAYNISPSTNTPTSWKTALDGEGIYWTWYDTANTFTNQPSRYGLLRTVIGHNDVRQDFYVQTSGQHYYRTGNTTGWYGQSGSAGAFRYLGDDVDTALSTTSNNPVRNSTVTAAINDKQDALTAGSNIQINNNVISATDTTYSDFTGTDGAVAGAAGLVPAPNTTDSGKFLSASGAWETVTAPPSVTVTSTPAISYSGASSTDVMSQLGTYRQVHADNDGVQIGGGGVAANVGSVTTAADYSSAHCIAIGGGATVADAFSGHGRIAIGDNAKANRTNSIAIGSYSFASGSYGTANSVAVGTCARTSTSADYNTVIGGHAYSAGKFATVIGSGKRANPTEPSFSYTDTCAAVLADYGVAVGTQAQVLTGCPNSVALGYHSKTSRASEVSIGDGSSGTAYGLRYVANVKDGVLATDAATVGQLPTAMTGATSSTAGTSGLVPAPAAGDEGKYLKGDGTWGGEVTIRLLADPMSSDSLYITDDMTSALPTSQLYFSALFSDDVNRVVYENYDMDESDFTSYEYYTIVNKHTDTTSNSGTCTLVDDSGTTIVLSGSLESTTAAKTITVTRPINSEEVIYNYTQASNSAENVEVDAPIDFTTYREIRIVVFDISTQNGTWMTLTPMNSAKSSLTTYLHGYEVIGSTISAVNRSDTQCGAVSIGANGVGGVETIIERGYVNDWSAFQTHGFGEGSVQSVGGLIKSAASGTAYVRVRLVSPKVGSRVTVYGKR